MTPKIALVTAREALSLDEDMPPLVLAFQAQGADVETPCWDDPAVDWGRYDAAVLRSTWDYVDRIDEFLDWADRCAGMTRLSNSPEVVRWNTDKHYLVQLANAGVPVVPTRFVEPGTDPAVELDRFLAAGEGAFTVGAPVEFAQFVVKPSIGAGSRDAARYTRSDRATAVAHVARLLAAGRSTMLQPYLDRVDDYGETAVVYIGGRYSHAIRKGPLLRLGDDLVSGLFAPEHITPREPDSAELAVAAAAFATIAEARPLYARIDLIRDPSGAPVVLELELTEPSLFFLHAPDAAGVFADALLAR
jgi:O-ureido-D-serine cyclo-ligase